MSSRSSGESLDVVSSSSFDSARFSKAWDRIRCFAVLAKSFETCSSMGSYN